MIFSIFLCLELQDISTCTAPDGNNYQANTTFTTSDCLMHCVCTPNGHIGCVPLCPSVRWKCPIGYKRTEVTQHAGVKDSGCFCKKVTCKALTNNGEQSLVIAGRGYYGVLFFLLIKSMSVALSRKVKERAEEKQDKNKCQIGYTKGFTQFFARYGEFYKYYETVKDVWYSVPGYPKSNSTVNYVQEKYRKRRL